MAQRTSFRAGIDVDLVVASTVVADEFDRFREMRDKLGVETAGNL